MADVLAEAKAQAEAIKAQAEQPEEPVAELPVNSESAAPGTVDSAAAIDDPKAKAAAMAAALGMCTMRACHFAAFYCT